MFNIMLTWKPLISHFSKSLLSSLKQTRLTTSSGPRVDCHYNNNVLSGLLRIVPAAQEK